MHPRKVFFYLTTQPRMPLPENSDDIIPLVPNDIKRLTPSVSDPSVAGDEMELEGRGRSLSPEIELYSPGLEHDTVDPTPPTPGEAFSGRSSLNPDGTPDVRVRSTRAPSPALEADERGFTETATAVRARGMSLQGPPVQVSVEMVHDIIVEEDTPEQQQIKDHKLAQDLFGQTHLHVQDQKAFNSSPMMPPKQDLHTKLNLTLNLDDVDMSDAHMSIMSPEMIDVDELDSMFTGY